MQSDDDIDLLSLAVTAAESWRILLIGPVIVMIVAFGISRVLPRQFESVVTVPLSVKSNQALVAAGGVGAVLAYRPPGEENTRLQILISAGSARFKISARNVVTGNVDVSVRSSDPLLAQKLLSGFVSRLTALVNAQNGVTANEIQTRLEAYLQQNESVEKILLSGERSLGHSVG